MPASRPAATRSSPSQTKRPSSSRYFRRSSLRTSFSCGFDADVITGAGSGSGGLDLQGGLRLLGDRGERGRVGDGEIGEHLAVELDPRLVQPATNWLYESPCSRAAALIRMIQSERIVRLRFLRSR